VRAYFCREGVQPSGCDFVIRPGASGERVEEDDEVEVIAHDGVGVDIDGEGVAEEHEALDEPVFTVREVLAGEFIDAAQACAAHAARDEVVAKRVVGVDEQ
jgi:hypothetical protein